MRFFKRNNYIFLIGGVAILAILAVIIIGQDNETGISLRETLFNVTQRNEEEPEDVYFPEELSAEEEVPRGEFINPSFDIPDKRQAPPPPPDFPIIEVVFNGELFLPRSFQVHKGQIVKWTNVTEAPITIKELLKQHEEFENGVVLGPGESYQLELYGEGIWTYKETKTGAIGRILIL